MGRWSTSTPCSTSSLVGPVERWLVDDRERIDVYSRTIRLQRVQWFSRVPHPLAATIRSRQRGRCMRQTRVGDRQKTSESAESSPGCRGRWMRM